ncbi:tetratricopeptide repeat protein [Nonomuraea angiospora]|uniref:Tetratricopeptide (TPR) repeat protein n=1 Tax=Nonomuraea angiospora TaxID=46172 RepID=A0ABR9MCA0_9ACTN|nr:tetratricopeptide repeat protein [Nonomuraea angiospora]MBE1590537.1 tetratricopeptide (TPR) repeat protein [Nonomuraea angiospora]
MGRRLKKLTKLKSPWVLGAVASIGAGVTPLVVPGDWPLVWRALIAAVVAALAGASGSYFGVVLTRAESAAAAVGALHVALDPLNPPQLHRPQGPAGGERSVFELLAPQSCPTPFWGRRAERDWWWAWCQEEELSGLLVVDGPGGCGKTRLALRAAQEAAADGWVTGWLREGKAADLVAAAAAAAGRRVLALVDNADTRTDLASLLEALAHYQGPALLRVVLITRHGVELGQALQAHLPERHALLVRNAPLMSLLPLGETSDLIRWYGEAVRAFASAWGTPPPPVSDTNAPVREGQTMAELLAQAMVTVLRRASPTGSPAPLDEVAGVLFEHEARWWRGTAALDRWALAPVSDPLLARVMTGLALFAPADEPSAVGVLRRVPELADAPAERVTNLVRWAHALYPPTAGAGLRIGPNLLADWFITTSLTRTEGDRHFARQLLNDPTDEQAARILTLLARAGEHHPPARLLFEQLLGGDPVRLAHHAVYAALTTATNRGELDQTTATALATADLDPDTTTRLLRLTPAYALPRCVLALARHHVRHTRATGTPPELGDALTDLVVALNRVGEHREELQAAREALDLFRGLADGDPVHRAGLNRALSNLSVALDGVGEYREEVRVAREALALCRELADDDPVHRPVLGRSLIRFAVALARVGQHREQVEVVREAVGLCRELVDGDPAHRPDLARAMTDLAIALDAVGEHREQVRVAREAVELCRWVADDNPAHRPALAQALIHLAAALERVNDPHEQLGAAREAVDLCRELVADNPAHRFDLAEALVRLAGALDGVGERREQVRVAREAVGLCRKLAADNSTPRPALARSLDHLSVALHRAGEHREMLQVAREAVDLCRELVAGNPAHRPALARSLGNVSVALHRVGDPREQVRVAREAVDLYRELADDDPTHRPALARALLDLSAALERAGEHREQIQVTREVVDLYRELAARDPDLFQQPYVDNRAALRRLLPQQDITFDL